MRLNSFGIRIASPEEIHSWSYGEVISSKMVSEGGAHAERGGLFCEAIFGPENDYRCSCGKYEGKDLAGFICEACGVELTSSSVRKERMGHVELAVPVAHPLYWRHTPSYLALLLGIARSDLERVLHCTGYFVTHVDEGVRESIGTPLNVPGRLLHRRTTLEVGSVLSRQEHKALSEAFPNLLHAATGGSAIYTALASLELIELARAMRMRIRRYEGRNEAKQALIRLRAVEAIRKGGVRPEWMMMKALPILPPLLRPLRNRSDAPEGTSLNDLYASVIVHNNRIKQLQQEQVSETALHAHIRELQRAVDRLIYGEQHTSSPLLNEQSLSNMIQSKGGHFRRGVLGKPVDYSGRSVAVPGPQLKMGQCGLPKTMALELFKPFVIGKLLQSGYATEVSKAARLVQKRTPIVWQALEEVVRDRVVLLIAAPIFSQQALQAFEPVLIGGKAIQLHPLACAAFRMGFEGNELAVHVPLTDMAVAEAKDIMMATHNLLEPASGQPIVGPSKDMVLGIYYITMMRNGLKGEGRVFSSLEEVETAYELGYLDIHTKIKVLTPTYWKDDGHIRYNDGKGITSIIETSPGRVLFNLALPEQARFVNRLLDRGSVNALIYRVHQMLGDTAAIDMVDAIKDIGFRFATVSGTSVGVADLTIPEQRADLLDYARKRVDEVDRQFRRGLLTEEEVYQRTIELWNEAKDQVADAVKQAMDPNGPLALMVLSGANKGGFGPITQLVGMRGLMADPQGRIIPVPIESNFLLGLESTEYFISTHGTRKGLTDTALRTTDVSDLTRRLINAAQDIVIMEEDCGTTKGMWVRSVDNLGRQTLAERLIGRVAAKTINHPETDEIIINADDCFTVERAEAVDRLNIDQVYVYSPMTCELSPGLCRKCYGTDLVRSKPVELGMAVGIIAAQSIGEPGMMLTLRTFHTGTASTSVDMTQGLPRVEELFEARAQPKGEAIMAEISGEVTLQIIEGIRHVLVADSRVQHDDYEMSEDWTIFVKDNQKVEAGEVLAEWDKKLVTARHAGRVILQANNCLSVVWPSGEVRDYVVPEGVRLLINPLSEKGQRVNAGDQLTEGSRNPHRILEILGRDAVMQYLLREMQQVYRPQGQNIHDKHFEVILRKMLSKVVVTDSGDTDMLPSDLVESPIFLQKNENAVAEGGQPAQADPVLLGVTALAREMPGFLAASSSPYTIHVLTNAAIQGAVDTLEALWASVMLGNLAPVGTGFRNR